MTASIPGGQWKPATGAATIESSSQGTGSAGLEQSIARLLTLGTYGSIALLVVGVILMLARGIVPLSGAPTFDPAAIPSDLAGLRPEGFLWLGLVAVVATPSARVAASLIGYARRRDRAMVAVAALVLVVIAVSVLLAKGLEG
jgi:uncharacterized membrane protein